MSKKYIWLVFRWKIMPEDKPDIRGPRWFVSRGEAELALQDELLKYPEGTLGKTDARFLRMDRSQPASVFLDKPATPIEYVHANGGWIRSILGIGRRDREYRAISCDPTDDMCPGGITPGGHS